MRFFKKKPTHQGADIDPNEILLDASNLPKFNVQQFEGRIEKPISKYTMWLLGFFFISIQAVFLWKISGLQILQGENLRNRAENNRLERSFIFSSRGTIYDRNRVPLAWNTLSETSVDFKNATTTRGGEALNGFPLRKYIELPGFGHLLGYVSYPAKDSSGVYYATSYEGKDGVEKEYDEILNGISGVKMQEVDSLSRVHSESVIEPPIPGKDLTLTIDSKLQKELYRVISETAVGSGFHAGAGVIMDVNTGEVLAMTSYPEYNSQILTDGSDKETIARYRTDTRKPFLDRVVSGLYTPGSVVKPIMALAALNEGIISPEKKILSTGSISIPNPYFPDKPSVFKDWKAHGYVDMRDAIAVSSDVYFYAIGGGYKDQKGLGIEKIDKYVRLFGYGSKTGIDINGEVSGTIPTPEWKKENFQDTEWLLGDTYHTVIGQYGFQTSPLQIAHAIGAIATNGALVTPHVVANSTIQKKEISGIPQSHFEVIHDGMRRSVLYGTAAALNVNSVNISGKTGTAELGVNKDMVNSWITGFFPSENPRYSFAVVMERGPVHYGLGAPSAMRQVIDWMALYTPEYFK
jgi:penicillin-binding protein 2